MRITHYNRIFRYPHTKPSGLQEKLLIALLVLCIPGSLAISAIGIWMMPEEPFVGCCGLILGPILLLGSIMELKTGMAIFRFAKEGVYAKYPLEKQIFIPWEDFQQVCICYYSRATEMFGVPIICLVKKGERTNVFGRWKTANPLRWRNVLCLDFSPELLDEVAEKCPYDIPDLRNTGNYSL